jgi:CRP/FNR family transcriptional regulator, dissimilatory nitrate respiration regulator
MQKAEALPHLHTPEFFARYQALWQQLKPTVRIVRVGKSDAVVRHGDSALSLWLVHKGWVKLTRQTPDGKETVVGLCAEGDVFGEASLFASAHYPYNAEAAADGTELYAVPGDQLRAVIRGNVEFSSTLLSMLNERVAQTQLKLEHMNTMSTAQRLGCFLLRLCRDAKSDRASLAIPVEKHVLAAYLGMKPETFSRSQQHLKEAGVQVHGAQVDIKSVSGLREFVCNSCSESGSCESGN